jgi:hypothetical protein
MENNGKWNTMESGNRGVHGARCVKASAVWSACEVINARANGRMALMGGQPTPALITVNVASSMIQLTDQEILLKLGAFEDSFVERKTASDSSDWLDATVAFANTATIGYPAILFIGVRNDGTIEDTTSNLDKLQMTLGNKLAKAYPTPYWLSKVLQKDGKQFLAIIIPGSERRPHFAGPAFVRDGSRTVVASTEQFDRLVAQRNSKTYEILQWKGKAVSFTQPLGEYMISGTTQWSQPKSIAATVIDCNQYYVTLENIAQKSNWASYPLRVIELNYDNARSRLELRLLEGPIPSWASGQ